LSIFGDGLSVFGDGFSIFGDGLSVFGDGFGVFGDGSSVLEEGLRNSTKIIDVNISRKGHKEKSPSLAVCE